MVTSSGLRTLTVAEIPTASDPRSCRDLFWEALARGDREVALECSRRIAPPVVVEQSFSFPDEDDEGEGIGIGGSVQGTSVSVLTVEVETPTAVKGGWNSDKAVSMVSLEFDNMCLACVDKGGGSMDFRACSLPKNGALGRMNDHCQKQTHAEPPATSRSGATRLRLQRSDPLGAYAVAAPTSSESQHQKSVFSRPLFLFSEFPKALLDMNRHHLLLEIRAKPRVFKYLLEGYPGERQIWELHVGVSEEGKTLDTPSRNRPVGDEVVDAPGLASILRDASYQRGMDRELFPEGSTSQDDPLPTGLSRGLSSNPTSNYVWEREEDPDEYSFTSTVGGLSAVGESASLNQVLLQVNTLSKTVGTILREEKAKNKSLGATILQLKSRLRDHGQQIHNLEAGGTGSLFEGYVPPGQASGNLSAADRQDLTREVISSLNMGQYALKSDLPDTRGFAKLTDVERYVDNRYVTHSQLAEYRYVNRRELEDAISNISNITIPSGATDMDRDLELRVHALEQEVLLLMKLSIIA